MMMKLKWVVLFSLGVASFTASAEQSTVINPQAAGDQPAAANAPTPTDASKAQTEAPNRPPLREGARVSLRERTALAKAAKGDSNEQQGEAFLAENKAKPGVVTLASGVQYKILTGSKGKKKPTDASQVKCRYVGKLIDGTVIDRTDETKPAELNVAGFLPGLKEAVKLMAAGSKWQIVIPPQLAYGDKGNRGVGPNAVLVYDMQIISIK
jgi:FKBP-type peptidyl-prolyl cis-trans isomerase FklB